ncbi:hypothetical protein PENARI_c006G06162 [Penicillium arizonense]|uniref:Ubiquitin-like domain-containing protein n=1 Tax=Penicillium arizonense TaxID=1835702 RepID=A0A1F5LMT8_PENAI|nr:hypothetical protein PENARI_c006G06162 [Penicillium arizonense]OGE54524.1 hypothetical protein PENARI_c006G06162 [Penicillium arizonense]
MTLSISIDPDPHGSDHSLSDEDSSGVHVSVPSEGSHDFQDYDEWAHLPYPHELKPSDSASRPRTSRSRPLHGSHSASGRRPTSRRMIPERDSFASRGRRQRSPDSPDSVESDEFPPHFERPPPDRRAWPPTAPPAPGYAHSQSSGPSYNAYPPAPGHQPPYAHPNAQITSDLMRIGHPNQAAQPPYGAPSPYGYNPQFQPPHGSPMHHFFPDQSQQRHMSRQPPQSRNDLHNPQAHMPHPMAPHGAPNPYGASPFPSHELMAYGQAGYYRDPTYFGGPMPGMIPPHFWPVPYPQVSSPPTQAEPKPSPPPPPPPAPEPAPAPPAPTPADTAKDEAIARLEQLIINDRKEREDKEKAIKEAKDRAAAEKAAQDAQTAHDMKIASEAAALARADAEAKAAEDAAKAKGEAEKAAAAAAAEAAAAATAAAAEAAKPPPPPPAPEKKKPIKFKDAVGRKFSFPFELCATWQGMEELIRQAFLHIEVIGPHVADGHYDLIGPNGDIILPQVWETVIEPDWAITMHMWPIPEKPKEDPPPPAEVPAPLDKPAEAPPESKKKAESGNKKAKAKGPAMPGSFAMWMLGNNARPKQVSKAEKKPEPPASAPPS